MSKLIQLKLSTKKLKKYGELVNMLALNGTFGEYQKAIDFSIDFTISNIKTTSRVLPELESDKLDIFIACIKKLAKDKKKQESISKIQQST